MSCEFCERFDFTSVAVRDNNIHTAGGSSRFTDDAYDDRGFQLFQFCPICGCSLLYEKPSANRLPAHSSKPVKVALDSMGNRIDYAVFDDDTTMPEDDFYIISQLRTDCGVGFQLAKDAYRYAKSHNGDYDMMVAYIKAKVFAVNTGNMPFDKRVERFMGDKK